MVVILWRKNSIDEVGLTAVRGSSYRSLCADGITSGYKIVCIVVRAVQFCYL